MYSLACSDLNSRRKKREYKGQKSAARSHIVYIGAITHMPSAMVEKSKERVSILICASMNGSEKLPVIAIGKFVKCRCFKCVNG